MITILCSPQKKNGIHELTSFESLTKFPLLLHLMISLLAHIKETKHSADGFILPFVLSDLLLLSLKSNLGCMSNAFGLNWGGGNKINFRFH